MISDTTKAWILHKRAVGETSLWVTFFTETHGVLLARCKGGRYPKNQATLQAFTPLWLHYSLKGEHPLVHKVEMIAPTLHFQGVGLFSTLYLNELLCLGCKPNDSHEALFLYYGQTLSALATTHNQLAIESCLRRFEQQFLMNIGYQVIFTHDARSGVSIDPACYYQFVAGVGIITSNTGIPGAHIVALAQDELSEPAVLQSAKRIMRAAIVHALHGQSIRTRKLFSV